MKNLRTLSPSLPIEIFRQHISIHLPFKSLLRFKGVCKQWNDVIEEPDFIIMHLHHTKQQNNSQKLMIYSYHLNEFYSLDHQAIRSSPDYIQAVKLRYPNPKCSLPVPLFTTMAGSVDGLVCISSVTDWDKSSTVLVWNPATRVHKILPRHPDVSVMGMHGIGFGYNSTADDYNVVRVVSGSRLDIYSLKTNSWKLFMSGEGVPGHSSRIQNLFRTCSVDGSVYWLACPMTLNFDNQNDCLVACFDLKEVDDDEKKNKEKKLIKEIPVPGDFGMINGFAELKVMGECLSLFKVGKHFESLEMWTMVKINETTNDEVEYTWTNRVLITKASFLVHDYCMFALPKLRKYGVPICLSKEGKIVLRIPDKTPNEFVLYDTHTEITEDLYPIHWISERGINTKDKVPIEESHMYIESLVSPNQNIQSWKKNIDPL